jgi:hypothetical protein
VRQGKESGLENDIQEGSVDDQQNESSLGEETEVTPHISETLLGHRQSTGLGSQSISPLQAHDGNEISRVRVLKSLSGVADRLA